MDQSKYKLTFYKSWGMIGCVLLDRSVGASDWLKNNHGDSVLHYSVEW